MVGLRLRRTARCAAASVLTMWPAGRGEYDRPAGPAGVRSMEPADRRTGQGSDQHTAGTEPVPVSAPDRRRFGHPVVRGIQPERVRDDTAVDLVQRLPLIAHVFDYAPVCDHSRRQGAHVADRPICHLTTVFVTTQLLAVDCSPLGCPARRCESALRGGLLAVADGVLGAGQSRVAGPGVMPRWLIAVAVRASRVRSSRLVGG